MAHVLLADPHRQSLLAQTETTTISTVTVVLERFKFFANPVAIGLAVTPLHIRDHALKGTLNCVNAATLIVAKLDLFLARATQKHLVDFRVKILPTGVLIKPVMLRNRLNRLQEIRGFPLSPRCQRPISNLQRDIGDNQVFVEKQLDTKPITARTSPKRRVKRKQARLNLGDRKATDRTGEFLGEREPLRLALRRCGLQNCDPVSQIKRSAETIRQPCFQALTDHNPVHDNINIVAQFLIKRRRLVQLVKRAIYLYTLKARLA